MILLLWLGLSGSQDLSNPFSEIRVEGNQHVAAETIVETAAITNETTLPAAFRRLWETGLFEDIRFEREHDALVIHVDPKPLLASYRIEAARLPREDLAVELDLRANRPFGETERARVERRARALLGEDYEVTAVLEPSGDARTELTVTVERASFPKIKSITFEGNEALDDEALLEVMRLRPSGWTTWATGRHRLRPTVVEQDLERIRTLYLSRGFADVDVGPAVSGPDLRVPIVEGRAYRLAEVTLDPGDLLSDEQVRDWLPDTGEAFNASAIDRVIARLERYYRARGYPAVAVIRERNLVGSDAVRIDLRVEEGRFFRVGRISFHGNRRHRDRDLRQHLDLDETGRFNQDQLEAGLRAISRLQTIASAEPEVDFATTPGRADITYRVREVDRFEYLVGGGLNGVQGGTGNGQFIARSLFGRGDVWRADVDLGNRFRNIALSYRDPSTLRHRLFLTADFARADLTFPDETSQDSLSFAVRAGGPQGKNLQVLAGFELAHFTLDSALDGDIPFLTPFIGERFRTGRFATTLAYDNRDQPFLGRRGRALQVEGELVFRDVEAFRARAQLTQLVPVGRRHVVSLSGRLEAVSAFGSTRESGLPRFERLFLGSENDLRGFAIRGVGPRSNGVTVGGDRLVFASAEYQFIAHPRLRFAGFFDTGNVYASDFGGDTLPRLRYDAGVELQWLLPFGNLPLRTGYGFNLDRVDSEKAGRFFFTLSIRF